MSNTKYLLFLKYPLFHEAWPHPRSQKYQLPFRNTYESYGVSLEYFSHFPLFHNNPYISFLAFLSWYPP